MKPETVLRLQDRLKAEISGLQAMNEQLADPETGMTPGGLKSGLVILTRSILRTNQILLDVTRAAVVPPSAPFSFASFFGK